MLHFEWDHMTINETCLTSFCALRIWGKNSWLKHKWFWKCYFCKLWVFIYLKCSSDRPHSASFRVKTTFPFYSTERISWNHHSPLISITELKRESGFLSRMRLIMVYQIITSNRWTLTVCTNTVLKKVKPTFPFQSNDRN